MSVFKMEMPQMGESIAEGTIIKWLKKEGDTVERDEIILEISTDKVDSEIPSPEAGVIRKLAADEGDTIKVGEVIAHIETDADGVGDNADADSSAEANEAEAKDREKEKGQEEEQQEREEKEEPRDEATKEKETAAKSEPSEKQEAQKKEADKQDSGATETETKTRQVEKADASVNGNGERKFFSPLVRSIAKAEGIEQEELHSIEGTGLSGRVTKNDIMAYLDRREKGEPATQTAATSSTKAPESVSSDDRVEILKMDTMRKAIANHMVNSVQTSPHVFMASEADMTNLVRWRSANKEEFLNSTGTKITYMPFIINACVRALQDYPLVNSSLDGDKITRKKYINIGVAVALENNGLIVPVIKNADSLNIVGLARAINDLAARARSKKLKPDEVQDGTFSITNMGTFGSLMGFPIINQPQVAILGVGAAQKRPVIVDDAIAIREMMYVTLSFDHRIVDGALAGQFIERVTHYLTDFDTSSIL